VAAEILVAYSLAWLAVARRVHRSISAAAIAAAAVLFVSEFVLVVVARSAGAPPLAAFVAAHVVNLALVLVIAWNRRWEFVAPAAVVPTVAAAMLALLLRELLLIQPAGERDLGRLAFVAAAALAFATVAIPLQLKHQWITIGWALEGAALCWLYRRVPHRGLFFSGVALMAVVFARLALNPSVFVYEPRGMRVFNWYLYAYLTAAVSMLVGAWWLTKTDDRLPGSLPRASTLIPAAAVILLFLLLNIEIADFYAAGPEITFRFGVTLAQDLTYTIGWLIFGLVLLAAGIYSHNRPGRIAAVALITITMCKAFLYDVSALGGLYRVASLVGLALSLSLVALALQKFVVQALKEGL